MAWTRRISLSALIFTVLLAVFVLGGVSVFSQSSQEESGSGLSISPTRTPLTIRSGESGVIRLNLRNVTNSPIIARPIINDFRSDNESDRPQLLTGENNDVPSIRTFLSNLEDIRLNPGESKTFEIMASIPEDASPGGYYGIIRYAAVPEGADDTSTGQVVSLTASVATIVLIEVPGEIREQVQVREILTYRKGVAAKFFSVKPEEAGVRVQNQGNGFVRPFGSVALTNPLGKETHRYELIDPGQPNTVLPESARVFKKSLQGVSMPGRYVLTANISFNQGGEVLTVRGSFWYMPIWATLLVLLVIVLIGLLTYWIGKKIRHRKRRLHR